MLFLLFVYIFITIFSIYVYFERSKERRNGWFWKYGYEKNYESVRNNRMLEINSLLLHIFWPFSIFYFIHNLLKLIAKDFVKIF